MNEVLVKEVDVDDRHVSDDAICNGDNNDSHVLNNGKDNLLTNIKFSNRVFKIIVIGDSNVGKTCLTYRFCGGKFPQRTEATIGVDFREKQLNLDGELIKLQLWDTAGQERFRKSMVQHYYRNVQAVVFVYDVTKISSFQNLSHWISECNYHDIDMANIPRILVGNKCDCSREEIVVNTNVAQKFADEYNMPLFETSAKENSLSNNVDAIFWTLAHKLKNSKPMIVPLFDHNCPKGTVRKNSYNLSSNQTGDKNCSC